MALLSLVAFLIALFIGRVRGLAFYGIANVIIWVLCGMPKTIIQPGTLYIFIISCGITIAAIMVQRWWGLLLSVAGYVTLVIVTAFGVL